MPIPTFPGMSAVTLHDTVVDSDVEEQAQQLLAAFLRVYFDGAAHDVGGYEITFPLLEKTAYSWGLDQPEEVPLLLHGKIEGRATEQRKRTGATIKIEQDILVTWQIRVANAGDVHGRAKRLARQTSGKLQSLFMAKIGELSGKGITRTKIQRAANSIRISGYQVYQMITNHRVVYTHAI